MWVCIRRGVEKGGDTQCLCSIRWEGFPHKGFQSRIPHGVRLSRRDSPQSPVGVVVQFLFQVNNGIGFLVCLTQRARFPPKNQPTVVHPSISVVLVLT
jgi:hypothetical protein